MNKHKRMYQQIENHGKNLINIFNLPETTDPVKLCKSIMRLETKAHRAATCLCNTNTLDQMNGYPEEQTSEADQDMFFAGILAKLDKILNFEQQNIPVFINHDPRGYALKIKSEYVNDLNIYRDFGGYGILAPMFDAN